MRFSVRPGSISELIWVNQQIEEFAIPYDKSVFDERLSKNPWYGLVAESADGLIGFKVGYEQSEGVFYSWLGGVLPVVLEACV